MPASRAPCSRGCAGPSAAAATTGASAETADETGAGAADGAEVSRPRRAGTRLTAAAGPATVDPGDPAAVASPVDSSDSYSLAKGGPAGTETSTSKASAPTTGWSTPAVTPAVTPAAPAAPVTVVDPAPVVSPVATLETAFSATPKTGAPSVGAPSIGAPSTPFPSADGSPDLS